MVGRSKFKPVIEKPGSQTFPFKLGDEVKDKINGLTGVLVSRFYHITGCDRFAVEPEAKDGKPGEIFHVDGLRLELLTAHPDRHRDDEVPDIHINLGDKARSAFSGIEGTVVMIHVPLYGAVQVDLAPTWDAKAKKMPDAFFIDAHNCEVLEFYEKPAAPAPTTPAPTAAKSRGATAMPRGGYRAG